MLFRSFIENALLTFPATKPVANFPGLVLASGVTVMERPSFVVTAVPTSAVASGAAVSVWIRSVFCSELFAAFPLVLLLPPPQAARERVNPVIRASRRTMGSSIRPLLALCLNTTSVKRFGWILQVNCPILGEIVGPNVPIRAIGR